MIHRMPKNEGVMEPCRRCGKIPRADAMDYCWDCADTLALRGLLVPLPEKYVGEAPAEAEPDPPPEDEVP